jgi:thioredoxin reductase (NADPH)
MLHQAYYGHAIPGLQWLFYIGKRFGHAYLKYMDQNFRNDIAVIGAGPAGLFAVFQCGMLGLRCDVIDSLEGVGGQCTALYPEKPIYDIPGFPSVDAGALVANLERQASPFAPRYHLAQTVNTLARDSHGWRLETSRGNIVQAKAVIIAGGGGAFGPNRPPLDGLDHYEGRSVFYMVRRKQDFAGRRVVIAGGGDSAVDWALSLAEVAQRVSLVHRRDTFRAAPESLSRLKDLQREGRIDLVVPWQLQSLAGEDGQLTHVGLVSPEGDIRHLEADCLLPFFGLSSGLGPIAEWGLELDRHAITVDPVTCATSLEGIYAVGDIATYTHKLKLILTGFAEGAAAAHAAYRHIHPGRALHFEYSTTSGVPVLAIDAA